MKKLLFGIIISFSILFFSCEHPIRLLNTLEDLLEDYSVHIILLIIIIISYRNLISNWKELLAEKERELSEYKEELLTSQTSCNLLKEEMASINKKNKQLEKTLSKKKAQLKKVISGEIKIHQPPNEKATREKSISEGYKFDIEIEDFLLKKSPGSVSPTLNKERYETFIDYYKEKDGMFVEKLQRMMLKPTEMFVCIMFRKQFSHQQVVSVMGCCSETLSHTKCIIKGKMRMKGPQTLEVLLRQLP